MSDRVSIKQVLVSTFVLILISIGVKPAFAATSVFFNEIHYDNASTDTGEAIEIAGPAGTDLTGWSIVLYNGANSSMYDTAALSGTIPDNQNGYGTVAVSYPSNGIQNGSPDGMALVDASNGVVQFLSYEGSFTAGDGPANGLASTDIGVTEGSTTPAGYSLQLGGTGTTYEDFSWNMEAPATFGAVNNAQSFGSAPPPLPPAEVVINEVDSDTPGTDTAEFVELYDGGVGSTDLSGLVVVFYNGSNDSSYAAFDLDGFVTDANGYFVLGNSAVTPGLTFSNGLLQNGADAVALYTGNGSDFPNGTAVTTDNLVDAIVYDTDDADDAGLLPLLNAGQPQVNENGGGDKDNQSSQRCPNGSGGARNTDTYGQAAPTPGADNNCGGGGPAFGVCGDAATPIHTVQGSGAASPVAGMVEVIEGVVVGDYQDTTTQLGGFYLQEEDGEVDGDATTSEGIFVYDGGFGVGVAPGDVVRVRGTVAEYYDLTEISNVTDVAVCNSGVAVTPATITLPVASFDVWEHSEGMLVTIPQELTVTDNYTWGRYGEVELSGSGRLYTPTNVTAPGASAVALQDLNNRSRIQLDDASTIQNPLPLPPYIGPDNTLRVGDTVPGLTGVLSYSFGVYEIQPVGPISFARVNDRQTAPSNVDGDIRVVAVNVLNFFTTLDTGTPICGPTGGSDCRGANTADEFTRQRDKIVNEHRRAQRRRGGFDGD